MESGLHPPRREKKRSEFPHNREGAELQPRVEMFQKQNRPPPIP